MSVFSPAEPVPILVVDDDLLTRVSLKRILDTYGFQGFEAEDVPTALRLLEEQPVHLVLADLRLPGESGLDLVRHLTPRFPDVAVVMISSVDDTDTAMECSQAGAFAYVHKPFRPKEILIQVGSALRRRMLELEHRDRQRLLEQQVVQRTRELASSREELALRLLSASETRDYETGAHVKRIGLLAAELARLVGWPEGAVECIRAAAPMHDLGKIGVPDGILQKPGSLDDQEWVLMREHAALGARILKGSQVPFIQMGARIAAYHHEKWDGTGYPNGLKGDEIPMEARITGLVDVYDALMSKRHYKEAWSESEALAFMRERRGTHFDPQLLDLFFANLDRMRAIREENPDVVN